MRYGSCWCGLLAVLVHSCQSYEPSPLDPSAHLDAWERRLDDREVAPTARDWGMPQFEVGDGLELAEGRMVALLCHPELNEARRQVEVAEARGQFAARPPDPILSASVFRAVQAAAQPWLITASLMGRIPLPWRTRALEELSDARVGAALAQQRQTEVELLRSLDEAWLNWSTDRREAELLEEQAVDLDLLRQDAERLRRSGSLAAHQLRRLDIEETRLRMRLTELRAGERLHRVQLLAAMGLRADAPWEMVPSPAGLQPGPVDSLRDALLAHDPVVALSRASYEQSEKSLKSAIASQWLGPSLGPGGEWDDGDTSLGPSMNIPIPMWNRNQGAIALARAQRELARARFETALEQAETRALLARARLEMGETQALALREQMEPLMRQQWDELRRLAELGELDVALLLESWSDVLALRVERLRAEAECERSRLRFAWIVDPWTPSMTEGGAGTEEEER